MLIKANGKVLNVKDCTSLLGAMRGLMFSRESVALVRGGEIWMPFVAKPLHLYFLDGGMKVIGVDYAVPLTLDPKTWKVYSRIEAHYCLESVEELFLKKGTQIKVLPQRCKRGLVV